MKSRMSLLLMLVALISQAGCLYVYRYDGPYKGTIVDQETREPIEGAVVLGIWNTETPTLGGAVHKYFDASESVTGKDGNFIIPGKGVIIMSNMLPVDMLIFKSGYQYSEVFWGSIKTANQGTIKWDGEKPIIQIKKLTLEERRKTRTPYFPHQLNKEKKAQAFIKEINNELVQQGLTPYPEE